MPSVFGSLSPYEPEPAEIAAQRVRQAVKSPRQEGTATKVLDSYVPHVAQGLADILTFPGQYAQNYQPGQMAAADPSATDWAAGTALGMVGTPGAPAGTVGSGIKAYHGSPHSFDRFELSKIGTGEGAQVYGHGLYFAENEAVAKQYRDQLARQAKLPDDVISMPPDLRAAIMMHAKEPDLNSLDAAKGAQYAAPALLKDDPAKLADMIERIRESRRGRMYEVNINAEPEHFLDWDKPLLSQSEPVQEALQKSWLAHPNLNQTGRQIYEATARDAAAEEQRRQPNFDVSSPYAGSAKLLEAGIPGIKYLDQGSRGWRILKPEESTSGRYVVGKWPGGGAEQKYFDTAHEAQSYFDANNTSNYSVFNDKIIDILRRYGLAGATAGGVGASAVGSQLPAKFGSLSPQE